MCRKSMPSHSSIMEYWKNKYITKDFKISNNPKDGIEVINDWGEPSCWACKEQIDIYDNSDYGYLLENNSSKIWDYSKVKSKLNRCHIIPKALGGSNEANNIFLLCEDCHIESPDTIIPEVFFAWVVNKRSKCQCGFDLEKAFKITKEYCDLFNVDLLEFCKNLNEKEKHEMFEGINTHGGSISEHGVIGKMVYLYSQKNKL